MAAHSNRPSNPNPRNSESNSATRRSFSGNNTSFVKPSLFTNPRRLEPITPANSPSDSFNFPRRWSVETESGCDEKENEKDENLKASKLRSPAKNSKNFMSPTISAASKFAPSPKKKILVERNDPLRTSISLCDGKATFCSSINTSQDLDSNSDQNQNTETSLNFKEEKEAVHEVPPVSKPKKRVTFLDLASNSNHASESLSESVITDSDDNLKFESGLKTKVSSSSVSSSAASPNADSSLPPYDPETNYLSPRPQFLHYKPNPIIGILLNKEKLEDIFLEEITSENFSDSESTEESSQSEVSQKEEIEMTDPRDMVLGLDETEEDSHVLEPSISSTVSNVVNSDNFVLKRENKSRGLFKVMCFSMLLLFMIACASLSATRSHQFVGAGLRFSGLSSYYHEVSASGKVSFGKLARHVNEFSVNSMAFISKLIDKPGKGEKLGRLKFINITDLQKSIWNNEGCFGNNHIGKELIDDFEEDDEVDEDLNIKMNDFGEKIDSIKTSEMELLENLEEEDDLEIGDMEIEERMLVEITSDKQSSDLVMVTDSELENSVFVERQTEVVSHVNSDEITFEGETIEVAAEITKAETFEGEEKVTMLNNENTVDFISSSQVSQSSLKIESSIEKSENKLAHYIIGASPLFGALVAVVMFLYKLKRSHKSANIVVKTDPFLGKRVLQEKPVAQNLQKEVDEPCATEMSSLNSDFHGKKELRGEMEVQSFEGKPRRYSKRESLASSSTEYSAGAPSYGSFTTFERIPIKHGEDEIITPVRRSNRIRKQVTSP